MIVFLGDLHGRWQRLEELDVLLEPGVPVVQVGDLGWWPHLVPYWEALGRSLQRPVYWIDGNHEHFPSLPLEATRPVELAPNMHYVPRGTILELNNLRLGCIGGASSVNYQACTAGVDWFWQEELRPRDRARVNEWALPDVDVLVTHAAPQSVVNVYCPARELPNWGLPVTWTSPVAEFLETTWQRLGQPPLVCGHYHRPVQHDTVRILDIEEALDSTTWLRRLLLVQELG
jgi:hypothetical protein